MESELEREIRLAPWCLEVTAIGPKGFHLIFTACDYQTILCLLESMGGVLDLPFHSFKITGRRLHTFLPFYPKTFGPPSKSDLQKYCAPQTFLLKWLTGDCEACKWISGNNGDLWMEINGLLKKGCLALEIFAPDFVFCSNDPL